MTEEAPDGCRILPSDIGPVIPVADIADVLGYSRSAINKAMKEHEGKINPCKTFISLPTARGSQQVRCLNRQGVDYLLLFIHPSKARMNDDEYIEFRRDLLEKLSAEKKDVVPVQQAPGPQELDEVVAYDLIEAKQIAKLTETDPKAMQAAILRKHGYSECAEVLERQIPATAKGEPGWYNPTELAALCKDPLLTAERLNQYLANHREGGQWCPFQYREGKIWRLTSLGRMHGREYTFRARGGHEEPRIEWRESILYASGLKADIPYDQTMLPARAGV